MRTLALDPTFYIEADEVGVFHSGLIYHILRNSQGGSVSTPIGRYFTSRPALQAEGILPHWRIDCFVIEHKLAPQADWLGKALANALIKSASVTEPLWVSWHSSKELGGEPMGDVFDFD
ncbi:MAG: hypothetical protein ACRCWF_03510 [Beijerinckiaceae bacterium]